MFTVEAIASFNELETSIYNYVTKNMEKVIYMRVRELADHTHVSTATILRFCHKLDCKGFPEFKVKLKLYLDETKSISIKHAQHSVTEFYERILNGTMNDTIQEAAGLIANSDSIIFIGTGISGILAEYGARYFSSMGKLSLFIKDPHFPVHVKFLDNSITIALSVSGENQYTIKHLHQLKERSSKVISITNNSTSTISKISDINLSYYVTDEHFEKSTITTQVPVVYLLESLSRAVYALEKKVADDA